MARLETPSRHLAGAHPERRRAWRCLTPARFPALLAAALALWPALARPDPAQNVARNPRLSAVGQAPLCFEPRSLTNGITNRFLARGRDCNLLIAPDEAVVELGVAAAAAPPPPWNRISGLDRGPVITRRVRLRLVGADPNATVTGLEPLMGKASYFLGGDPAAWRTGMPLFAKIRITEVYPGIELVYYAAQSALEYDFRLDPGADPDRIALGIDGADDVRLAANGDLLMRIGDVEIRQHRPVCYQTIDGVRKDVPGGYELSGRSTARLQLGPYDRTRALVIDPVLTFSGYVGGKLNDEGWGIAVDGTGNVYIAGETLSTDLRANVYSPALLPDYMGGTKQYGDAFVAKYDGGTNLAYLTYLGGKQQDGAFAIAVDNGGNAFITGFTDSTNFPIWPVGAATNAFSTHLAGYNNNGKHRYPIDAFVTKLDPSGTRVIYSTYLGGNGRDVGLGIAVDSQGAAYVAGLTESTNFPTINSLQGPYVRGRGAFPVTNYSGSEYHGHGDAFVSKLSPDGSTLMYSTYLGGTNQEEAESIALDAANCAYVVGWTSSSNFPTTYPLTNYLNGEPAHSTFSDAFVAKLSAEGSNLVYCAYLGGSHNDAALHVAVDPLTSNAYVAGYTFSTNFPVTRTNFVEYVSKTNLNADVFVARFDDTGSLFSTNGYSVVFGGKKADFGIGLALDAIGDVYVTGSTSTKTNFAGVESPFMTNFFATNTFGAFSSTNVSVKKFGTNDTFVVVLDPVASNYLFSAFLGGSGNDQANGIAFDTNAGAAYLVGTTTSTNFPGTVPGSSPGKKKKSNAFVTRIQFP
jgi:hypothetical protein